MPDLFVKYLEGKYKGRCLVEPEERARQLIAQGSAVLANDELAEISGRQLEYMTREMTAAKPKKRGRPAKVNPEDDTGDAA